MRAELKDERKCSKLLAFDATFDFSKNLFASN